MVLIDKPGEMEDHRGGQDRDRNRGQRDRRRAPVQQEGEQDDRDHERRLEQHALHVADRGLDEVGLPEQDLIGLDARAAGSALSSAQRLLDLAGQRDGVDIRLLLDRDDDRGLAHVAGIAALDLGRELDGRDLMQDRPAARRPSRRRCCADRRGWWCGRCCGSGIRANAGR